MSAVGHRRALAASSGALAVAFLLACTRAPPSDAPAATPSSVQPTASTPSAAVVPDASEAADCGALGCRLYDTPVDAFRAVLERKPLVLGVGEAHAQKATAGVASSAKRFTTDMLPELKGKASDLVIELMVPPSGCEAKTKAVNKEMGKITAKQAETNQNEYVTMGDAAQKLGIEPHLLHPTCEDFRAITAPGTDAADVSLRLIARLMRDTTERALARNEKRGVEKIVVLYGGAIHNDVEPAEGTRDYGYGPPIVALTKQRYVELDVFVPELVHDSGLWQRFVWYPHFDRNAHPDKATLWRPLPSSFTIMLPATNTASQPEAGPREHEKTGDAGASVSPP